MTGRDDFALSLEVRLVDGERLTDDERRWLKMQRDADALLRELHGLDAQPPTMGDIARENDDG